MHAPPLHTSPATGHAWPQVPQLAGSVAVEVAHEVPASAQSAKPVLHAKLHVLDEQEAI
jgi:hypothetical protein